ncbi:PAS domain-containing protein [Pelosinus sp. Bkl1]|uniref:histidine kinase n=2 Tax=Pelosinus baikalensis TaxID=2892015 RepID=A0ABS8HZM8_9FIRM|nr:PAS domain-containing sensor histidine kinase [Pelosinus baikalensis]MCC5468637.1 PAS domain-containing protein [Pelosinus baikalensis]
MDYVYLSLLGAIAGTISMLLVYIYLYFQYRERYMGAWVICWTCHFSRTILFDSGIFNWKQSLIGFIIYQMMFIGCALMFIYTAHLFINRPLKRTWLYGAASASAISIGFTLLDLPILYKLLIPIWFSFIMLISVGRIFIHLKLKGIGKLIAGYAFILWGITTATIPFLLNIAEYYSWIILICGILRLIIASGTLLVYFEKTRMDLINKEVQYRLLAENAVDVIYRIRILPELKVEYISPSILAVTGYTSEKFYADSQLFESLIHPDDLLLFKQYANNPSLRNHLPFKYRLIHKDKSTVYIEQNYHPTYDEAGNLVIREGILRDVTARDNLEQVAAHADRMNLIGEMAASVAHEVRNPLTTIRGYLQMMVTKDELSNYKNRFTLMMEELDRANIIISEYLLLAKNKKTELKECSLNLIVDKLFPLIQANAAASNVLVKLELKEISTLYLDENEIRQLLLNLVRNGVEAMPEGGELVICTDLEQDKIVLSVKDQGTGLPAHVLENLGTPFITTKASGTGLGLPICYRIANRHNAVIDVKTNDQGTTFFVSFSLDCLAL